LEVGVDKVLEIVVEKGDFDIELNEFSVKLVVLVVQQIVSLSSELGDQDVESVGNVSDTFEAVLLQGVELLNGGEDVNELLDSSAEQIKLAKDGGRVEVELLFLQQVVDLALDHVVFLLVGVV
jgi:hypothetical protein